MTTVDEQDAIKALTYRLTEWGVDAASDKAKVFIGDLVKHGWAMQANYRVIRRPPVKSEECATHPGEWRNHCRCCASERRAAADLEANGPRLTRDDAIAAARAGIEAARTHTSPPPAEVRQAIADKPTTRPAREEV